MERCTSGARLLKVRVILTARGRGAVMIVQIQSKSRLNLFIVINPCFSNPFLTNILYLKIVDLSI